MHRESGAVVRQECTEVVRGGSAVSCRVLAAPIEHTALPWHEDSECSQMWSSTAECVCPLERWLEGMNTSPPLLGRPSSASTPALRSRFRAPSTAASASDNSRTCACRAASALPTGLAPSLRAAATPRAARRSTLVSSAPIALPTSCCRCASLRAALLSRLAAAAASLLAAFSALVGGGALPPSPAPHSLHPPSEGGGGVSLGAGGAAGAAVNDTRAVPGAGCELALNE
mmetsp:Transcript_11166/g.37113  ORF Transcript_11166/g.37113 Transcript_11166/m.37113 type:complete len:229 (-) Transcript_11166:120-806(-)